MKKIILATIFALVLFTGFNSPVLKASEIQSAGNTALRTASDDFIYIRVYENGAWWIYIYTSDGIFVAKYISV